MNMRMHDYMIHDWCYCSQCMVIRIYIYIYIRDYICKVSYGRCMCM